MSGETDNDPLTSQDSKNRSLYRVYQLQYEEILKHQKIESEKAGHDIGFDLALLDWTLKHRAGWLKDHPVADWNQRRID